MTDFKCTACPRGCKVSREDSASLGICSVEKRIKISRAALHYWEEPCLSGKKGSGTIFFSGCNLKCVYCQNKEISGGQVGYYISEDELLSEMYRLRDEGAHNINLVTPSHYYREIKPVLQKAKKDLGIPILSNTSSYDSVEVLKEMAGLIDIYLADFKYVTSEIASKYSKAPDYPEVAKAAIAEMYNQVGPCEFDEDGMMKKGIIVRNLLLPGHVKESAEAIRYIYNTYRDDVFISIMSQYTPYKIPENYPELNRQITKREYKRLLDQVMDMGVSNAFIQEGEVAKESFIPDFQSNNPRNNQ